MSVVRIALSGGTHDRAARCDHFRGLRTRGELTSLFVCTQTNSAARGTRESTAHPAKARQMAKISAADGVKLHVEEVGSGTPVVFVHEYAGDYRSWEPQVRHFSRQYRCVTYSQRGYPPSDVPSDPARYSQDIARDDVVAVMDALGIDK